MNKKQGKAANARTKMNFYQQQLYDELMILCRTSNGAFFYKDFRGEGQEGGGHERESIYRIFNYRLVSYSEFCKNSALECRGIMFLMVRRQQQRGNENTKPSRNGNAGVERAEVLQPLRLASLPMEKFFNLCENPFTQDLDPSGIVEAELKQDGSLISTYMDEKNELRLKTKFSLGSDQALAAMGWLLSNEETNMSIVDFRRQLTSIASLGYTVNLEWTSPNNHIVVPYEKSALKVLNIRSHETGAYVPMEELDSRFDFGTGEIKSRWTEKIKLPSKGTDPSSPSNDGGQDWAAWMDEAVKRKGIEGYVLLFENGLRVKLKTKWYFTLHHSLSSRTNRSLFEAVVDEISDDLRETYAKHGITSKVDRMEAIVCPRYNSMVQFIEEFCKANKNLGRKDFMIMAKKELKRSYFGLAARVYSGGKGMDSHYKKVMKSRWGEIQELFESEN